MKEALEVDCSPVVTNCEASKVLEPTEAALDSVAMFVDLSVVRNDDLAGTF